MRDPGTFVSRTWTLSHPHYCTDKTIVSIRGDSLADHTRERDGGKEGQRDGQRDEDGVRRDRVRRGRLRGLALWD